ncbi:MAG TPA: response regulator [Pyrinomonadaceae bacterium]|jgi:DNA-binding response OmpR family regulator|nr:response regulator [Pyrinomonadaceae bacterium]
MRKRILIIDDEEHIRRMMRLTLEASGYQVEEASNGAEGLSLYGNGSGCDVVVLDQRMPGMDGLETLRELKKLNEAARVVMATAYASIELAVDALKLGATDFVRKPMTPEVLRNAVTAALEKSHSMAGPGSQPLIQTVTMNGFTILDDEETPALDHSQRRFIVTTPAGEKHDVVVELDSEAILYVERMTGRRLALESSFWTSQARRLLSDFLWNERKVPPMRRLVLRSLDPDRLPIAARWKTEGMKGN